MNPSKPAFSTLLTAAHDAADSAREHTLRHFRQTMAVENKSSGGFFDPVTIADKAAERAIAERIAAHFPDHGFVGEEYGTRHTESPYRWVVDPIDGTRAFIMGSPMWGTLIGLLDGSTPRLGIMDQPFTGERYWSDETASYLTMRGGETRPLKTRKLASLDQAILTTTHPDLFDETDLAAFQAISQGVRMTRFGGDCYGYCLLAAGFVDIIVESGLKPFDIVALIPIIERAGGKITGWDGSPPASGGRILATGDARLHDQAIDILTASLHRES